MINSEQVVPLYGWILVEDLEPPEQTKSGIFIPKAAHDKESLKLCKVLKVSEDVPRLREEDGFPDIMYKVGDVVAHQSQLGLPINAGDEKDRTMLLKHDSICALIAPAEEEE